MVDVQICSYYYDLKQNNALPDTCCVPAECSRRLLSGLVLMISRLQIQRERKTKGPQWIVFKVDTPPPSPRPPPSRLTSMLLVQVYFPDAATSQSCFSHVPVLCEPTPVAQCQSDLGGKPAHNVNTPPEHLLFSVEHTLKCRWRREQLTSPAFLPE